MNKNIKYSQNFNIKYSQNFLTSEKVLNQIIKQLNLKERLISDLSRTH